MQSLSTHSVLEQMTNELAARRRATANRRAAYLSLARAIVVVDERRERLAPHRAQRSRGDWESAAAA